MMTFKEAKKLARIVEEAEGGCGGCLNEAVKRLNKEFPRFFWEVVHPEGFDASVGVTLDGPRYVYIPRTCG